MNRMGLVFVFLGGAVQMCGCAATASLERLNSPDPRERATAAVHAGEQKEWSAVPLLVDRLEDPDPAVRFYSIEALRRITGEDLGYVYYQSEVQRTHAVQRWRAYLQQRYAAGGQGVLADSNPEPGS